MCACIKEAEDGGATMDTAVWEGEGGKGCNGLFGRRTAQRSWHRVSRAQMGNRRLAPTIVGVRVPEGRPQ